MRLRSWKSLAFAALLVPASLSAQPLTLGVATNDGNVVNHWPAADGLIGTGDDVINANGSMNNNSGPNAAGTYSFNAFDFTGSCFVTDPWMPPCMNAMTFLNGTVTIDQTIAASGGGPLLMNWNVSGTEPFGGHGPYASSIAAVNGGTYTPGTGAFTMDVDFEATLGGAVTDTSAGMQLSGDRALRGPTIHLSNRRSLRRQLPGPNGDEHRRSVSSLHYGDRHGSACEQRILGTDAGARHDRGVWPTGDGGGGAELGRREGALPLIVAPEPATPDR